MREVASGQLTETKLQTQEGWTWYLCSTETSPTLNLPRYLCRTWQRVVEGTQPLQQYPTLSLPKQIPYVEQIQKVARVQVRINELKTGFSMFLSTSFTLHCSWQVGIFYFL